MLLGLWISGVGGPKCPKDKGAWGPIDFSMGPHGQVSQSQQEGLREGRAGIGQVGRGGEAWRDSRSPPRGQDQDADAYRFEGTRTMQLRQRRDLDVPGLVHGGRGWSGLDGLGGVGVGYQHEDPRPQQNVAQENVPGGNLERVQRFALLASQMLQQSQQSGAAGAHQSSSVDLGGSSTMVDNGLLGTALHTGGANWSSLQLPSQSRSAVAPRLPALQGLQGLQTASNFSLPLNLGDVSPLSLHPAAAAVAVAATASAPFSTSSNYALNARQNMFLSPLSSDFMW